MKRLLLAALISGFSISAAAQILHESKPLVKGRVLNMHAEPYQLPAQDIAGLQKEDELADKFKNRPWRFGVNIPVDIDPLKNGVWDEIEGKLIWRISISSQGALTLNYFFDQFFLPPSAELFIINGETNEYFGAITGKNNSDLKNLSTWPFEGDHHYILLQVDPKEKSGIKLHLTQVTHGYRNYKDGQGVGDADACNVDAICPQAGNWSSLRNSDVMIVTGNNGICSGTLVNNTLNDGRPYILTAEHCKFNANWTFRFNFQTPVCGTDSVPAIQSISGARQRAHNSESDFSLLEMNIKPPASYKAIYAGWDRSDSIPANQVCFHHPRGDLKKFSRNDDPGIRSVYNGVICWQIDEWELGTTESGSSGSGLYDNNGRIIGQLLGGEASCDNPQNSDYYGRLAISFQEHNGDSTKTLLYWLDPGSTGTPVLDSYDPSADKPTTDLAISGIAGIAENNCTDELSPTVSFFNNGIQTLTSATFTLTYDSGTPIVVNWTGSVVYGQTGTVSFGSRTFTNGSHQLLLTVSNPNGTTDENPINNSAKKTFTTNGDGLMHTMEVTLDEFGSEDRWRILDSNGAQIAAEGPFFDNKPGTKISTSVCLEPGCYKLEVTDDYGDGMCCAFGNGGYRFIESRGDTLATGWRTPAGPNGVPVTETTDFCIKPIGILEIDGIEFGASPNPTDAQLFLSFKDDNTYNVDILELNGRLLASTKVSSTNNAIDLTGYADGLYLIRVSSAKGSKGIAKIQIIH